ncbi:DNA-methyltransferase [Candidatus Magnetominusculus xianensis]|uniref:Methyltransferase n=1 Tax=Candidatus Magnetominusculus xianensis TaxID=1748249 RepID=A0ABR5SJL0_9BACT|nr:DNA methyltransferase [Candidatus Magnetominusculus xianensis]KWT86753.1 DNA methylase [Candidatus Magnetominusculus xianensis]MBF0402528.1 site-specific DNA-methyltransferase [Nitrospirota bacterium]
MTHSLDATESFSLGYTTKVFTYGRIIHADCFEWLSRLPENSLHAVVTDPPYGVREYDANELEKRSKGKGGVWRIPPTFDGSVRAPLPRFTALDAKDRKRLSKFFSEWSRLTVHALRPGGHVIIATNAFIAALLYEALVEGGLEFRGQLIRQVRTLRGGDRPKNAEEEFPDVSSMPRGCYEPWGLFRKPLPEKMTVSECLRQFQTGGLRRSPNGNPFEDIIPSERTPRLERDIADHPSLKPQSFMRQVVYASLPLGEGILADPFMGSGSTIAAAEAIGLYAIGVERYLDYFNIASKAIPELASLNKHLTKTPLLADVTNRSEQLSLYM